MTAQVGDKFKYKNREYSIVAISNPIQFASQDYNIIPEAICTACWAGYWCEYEITDEAIFLQDLYINSKDDFYPEINGVKVNNMKQGSSLYMGHHLYKDIHLPISYTGKIVVGKEFLREYYIHMGYQRAWAYKELLELVFEDGMLVESIDHSQVAEAIRRDLMQDGAVKTHIPAQKDILKFIEDSFSLELSTKAWWI